MNVSVKPFFRYKDNLEFSFGKFSESLRSRSFINASSITLMGSDIGQCLIVYVSKQPFSSFI